ncbi:class I SAM-dependent methyltransferase [Shouchella lonarensis]|uniref:Methyltransferase domain-containing protein n=1 Tax=Shouchella lonarensis TaxID=1464122 RepID=A0A1G6NE95_9BACI|nr:class I SAM-dependent methyltransferase [Shouchella lonarensis]SDC66108.1 Methyltransferase domain-containing protein [Shouchella lonarensis]
MIKNAGTEESIRRWNDFAKSYAADQTEQGDLSRRWLLNPAILSLIGDIKGKRVLDAGCGEGYLSRMLDNRGAKVTAVDYSTSMLDIAKKRTTKVDAITFQQGNCEDLSFLQSKSFDCIVSNMVIQDLANYEQAFQEMHRLLVAGGTFVFSILHPCFVTPEYGWERGEDGEPSHWKVDKYFYEGAYEQDFGDKENMLFFHRTLTSYVNTLTKTGFVLEELVEPQPSKEILEAHPEAALKLRRPDFIVFKLRRRG